MLFVGFRLEFHTGHCWEEYDKRDEIREAKFKTNLRLAVMPASLHQRMADEFYKFQQTLDISVTQLESKFRELSRYALEGAKSEA